MKLGNRWSIGSAWLAGILFLSTAAMAQQQSPSLPSGYDLAREGNLLGTVSGVVENSQTGPLGAHVIVQTSTGPVDVHVGSLKFLELNNLSLASGDSVRIIGETFSVGTDTVFLARIIQKGAQAVAVRSPKGMPLWPAGARVVAPAKTASQGGAR
jgi:hypothetical protein